MNKVTSNKLQVARKGERKKLVACNLPLATRSGFTLIEMLVYIALFSMIATTLVSLAYASAQENRETMNDVIQAYEND